MALVVSAVVCGCGVRVDGDSIATSPATTTAVESVTVPSTAGSVQLGVGQGLAVQFGTINYSVGDQWAVVSDPDPDVVRPLLAQDEPRRGDVPPSEEEPMPPGSSTTLTMRFVAIAPGHTTVSFQYSYRGTAQDPGDGSPGRRTIAITVS